MDANAIATVLNALPTSKLIDTVSKGIGKVCEPWHKRKMTDATVYEINEIGEALRNNSDVLVVYNNGDVVAQLPELKELAERTQHRLGYQELKKQYNIEKVVEAAYHELEQKTVVSDEPVDDDWICSFFDFVANVSSEQMQILWGKLLSGEITQPGTYSIRTLDVLRKLTQKEALLFKKYVPYILQCWGNETKSFKDYFLFNDIVDDFEGIVFPEIFVLYEAGLISMNGISITLHIEPNATEIISGLLYEMIFENTSNEKVEISEEVFVLTEAGKELYNVIISLGVEAPQSKYYNKCISTITEDGFLNEKKWKKIVNVHLQSKDI